MTALTLHEFDCVVSEAHGAARHAVPERVFAWLESQCFHEDGDRPAWLRPARVDGRRAVQVRHYAGVVQAPCGFQIEVLPKIGRHTSADEARARLIDMLKCLGGFRHLQTAQADLSTVRMPLLDVFIRSFLASVQSVVKRGVRNDYVTHQDNLPALRGKLLMAQHLTQNLARRDRFFTAHDEYSPNRPENRLLHAALRAAIAISRAQENQRLARELCFVFADVPPSSSIAGDLRAIRLDRGMAHYEAALDWARLILQGFGPVTSAGAQQAPSLLFPMEQLFEAYVRKHLASQLRDGHVLTAQASQHHLVSHRQAQWFRLKPDLLIRAGRNTRVVLDTKWKLLDASQNTARDKYQLSQADFYQLYAYGHHYLDGQGDLALIYPRTDAFAQALPVFDFPRTPGMRMWVLPFCLKTKRLMLPESLALDQVLQRPAD